MTKDNMETPDVKAVRPPRGKMNWNPVLPRWSCAHCRSRFRHPWTVP